jgi:hypothetical protein
MQIQIISADSQNVTRLAVAEHKAGQGAVKYVVQPGQKITLLADGVTLKGSQVVGSKKLKLVKSDKNLVIETEDGTEQIVELSDFFEQKDTVLTGNEWVFDEGSLLQTLDEGVVALAVPAAPALGSAMVGAAAGGFSATSVGAAAAGLGLIAGGGGGSTPSTAVTVDVQTPATNPFDKIEAYNNGNGTTPAALTLLDYQAAGVTGVNSDNLAAVNAQVLKQINGGADTLSEVQALVAAANAAIQKIEDYNRGNGTTPPALTVDDYEAAGITGVTPENLDALNAQVLKQVDGGADSVPEVQALANGLNTAAAKLGEFAQANTQGIATPTGTVPVLANYTAAGVTGVTDGSPTISPVGFMAVRAPGVTSTLARWPITRP